MLILVDDVRSFRQTRPDCFVARSVGEAIDLLRHHHGRFVSELWLDHDLGRAVDGSLVTVIPVVDELVAVAHKGEPYDIGEILIHTANPAGAVAMRRALTDVGYQVRRWYDTRIFVNRRTETALPTSGTRDS